MVFHIYIIQCLYSRDSRRCMRYVAFLKQDNHMLFVGDSRIRQLYFAMVKQVKITSKILPVKILSGFVTINVSLWNYSHFPCIYICFASMINLFDVIHCTAVNTTNHLNMFFWWYWYHNNYQHLVQMVVVGICINRLLNLGTDSIIYVYFCNT